MKSKPAGRPTVSPSRQLRRKADVLLRDAEYVALKKDAKLAGKTISRYLRERLGFTA